MDRHRSGKTLPQCGGVLAALLLLPLGALGASVDALTDVEREAQDLARESQRRVEELDDATLRALNDYNTEASRLDELRAYNENLRDMIASQRREEARVEEATRAIEAVRREIVPLMIEMVDVIEAFVELDAPFLADERRQRVAALHDLLARADVDVAEKFRRIVEAYQIEAEYGQNIEAWGGPLTRDGRERTVDYLRVGRTALYYVTLDRSEAGIYDKEARVFRELDEAYIDDLDLALRVARKQAPPNLLELPVPTGETGR